MKTAQTERYHLLDALRGLTLLSMIAYHLTWNLVHLHGMKWAWLDAVPGMLWQKSICCTFILLSGFCWSLGRHPWKNGLLVSAAGLLVTIATRVALPQEPVWFGVLTLLGLSMLLAAVFEPLLLRIAPMGGLLGCVLLFALTYSVGRGTVLGVLSLPRALYHGGIFSNIFGFQTADFYSSDYFPVFPWVFLFFAGYYLYQLAQARGWLEYGWLRWGNAHPVTCLGRHSLLVYLAHQPVLYGVLLVSGMI